MRPLIRLENVDVALNGQTVLRNISWQLTSGENWGISGGNGAGKSTFLKLLRAELAPMPSRGTRVYSLDGAEQTTAIGVKEAIALVSPELQSRYLQQEWRLTVLQVIHSGLQGGDYAYVKPTASERAFALQMAKITGADHFLRRDVQGLSTGELRKVLIARALVGRPRVLICDEICDGLDADSRASLLAILQRIAADGTQILYASHRSDEHIPAITQHLVLKNGQIESVKRVVKRIVLNGAEARRTTRKVDVERTSNAERPAGSDLIQVRNASVFLNGKRVLRSINWTIRAGENWALLGKNGAGKSTLLKLLVGDLQAAWGGSVRRFAFTNRDTIWDVKKRIGFVSPELQTNYRECCSGRDVIASGFFASVGLHRRLSKAQSNRVQEVARTLRIEALTQKDASQMSYGELRKLLIARAIVHRPDLLICDEPFDGLDAESREEIRSVLEDANRQGHSLVLVTHHLNDLPTSLSHVAQLQDGKLTFRGTIETFQRLSLLHQKA